MKKQAEINTEEGKIDWEEDPQPKDDGEVLKLQVGESVEGVLMDKFQSTKYTTMIFKVKVKDDDIMKVILSTTLLDRLMKERNIGELVKIERLKDSPSKMGKALQNWKVYHARTD